jgi:hypothetical protein
VDGVEQLQLLPFEGTLHPPLGQSQLFLPPSHLQLLPSHLQLFDALTDISPVRIIDPNPPFREPSLLSSKGMKSFFTKEAISFSLFLNINYKF